MMNVDENYLPWVYLVDGKTDRVIDFPQILDEPLDYNPDSFILWAEETTIELEILQLEGKITDESEEVLNQVQIKDPDQHMEDLRARLHDIILKQKNNEDMLLKRKDEEEARRESIREVELVK